MYSLRSVLSRFYAVAPRSLLFPGNLGQQRSIGTSAGGQQQNGTFYEFRTYIIQPGKVADFMKLTSDNIHLRTAHSELIGYWSVEIGCLNEVFHIWKYDSYKERAAVREALANNKDWQQNYISKMLPMLLNQTSEIVYMVPWAELRKPPKKGIYELINYQMVPGGPVVWGKAFQKAVSAHNHVGYCTLIGVFHSEFGHLNKVHSLWWHEDGDQRAAGRRRAQKDVRVVAAVTLNSRTQVGDGAGTCVLRTSIGI
ncbi:protein NipSnap homolog 3A isoform X2 [Carcharodon carcharias]|uniref:protein NipSnap homolog 3A isoform X2 n=1 Tax=Carcharodon carcharias TaxID=13397 RepID=UPI001B7E3CF9|nr:protein NipSnap homolog 3A isoform X2 [Carcharodon carcharias]XP_041041337.1 protein NipSnap homolog 3A isoform X2 [Carcharodon carcharias]